jgi:hypothetical protein
MGLDEPGPIPVLRLIAARIIMSVRLLHGQ